MQVEGLRNEYDRVTSGTNPKTSSSAGQSSTDEVSRLKQEAQTLQVGIAKCLPLTTSTTVHYDKTCFSAYMPNFSKSTCILL